MDATVLPTSLQRYALNQRSAAAPRRAYLDTYARQRAGGAPRRPATAQPVTPVVQAPVLTYTPQDEPAALPLGAPAPAPIVAVEPPATPVTSEAVVQAAATPASERLEANLRSLYLPSLTQELASADSGAAQHIRTVVLSALSCGVLALGIFAFVTRVDAQPVVAQPIGAPVIEVEAPLKPVAPRGQATPAADGYVARDPSQPVKIVISRIGVNAPVDGLGMTADGLIAVPKAYGVVGWYNKAAVPGAAGPAVLVGHFTGGSGGVFDKLGDLKDGDLITVTNGKKQSFTYKVSKKQEYAKNKVPMRQLFANGDSSRLEIITCAGQWQANNYDKRLVVTAELVK